MYRRFLNNDDYLGVVTADALSQMTRGNDDRFIQAEESAEMSLIEYLSEKLRGGTGIEQRKIYRRI